MTHRASTQRVLLLVVLLVAVMAGTLVSGLAVLVDASERFGLPSALSRVDQGKTKVTLDLTLDGREIEPALAAVDKAVAGLLDPVPATRTTEITGSYNEIGQGLRLLVYYAAFDSIGEHASLVSGAWPQPGATNPETDSETDPETDPGAGTKSRERTRTLLRRIPAEGLVDPNVDEIDQTVQVAVPEELARKGKLRVGDTFVSAEAFGDERTRAVVAGIYRVNDPEDPFWARDPLAGATRNDAFPVPRTGGTLAAPAYGPLVTHRSAFEGGILGADRLVATAVPHFEGIPPEALLPMLERSLKAQQQLQVTLAPAAQQAGVTTELASVLQQVIRFRYVTRTGVVIVALLLVVLALSALLLATRLLAERRFTEQSLMRARGASGRQLVRLGLIEAVLLGLVTAVASPPLARLLYQTLAARPAFQRAGLDHDPGLPVTAWLAAAGAAVAFVLVLIWPLLRRSTTFVEQEQSAARQDRRSLLQRSGVDLGLLVLAGVAYWQLRRYDSPLVTVDGQPRLDPVLVAGPALALLAGALVAVRVVPLISRRMETLAKGGRSIVLPLAAWEVGRRPQRAVGAVLLLTLALAIGTFSLAYLNTWQTSQRDQADFQVGAQLKITPSGLDPLAQASAIRALPGAEESIPLSRRSMVMADTDDPEFMFDPGNPNGYPVDVLAGDARTLGSHLAGRTVDQGGQARPLIETLPRMAAEEKTEGITLPGRPVALRATVSLTDPEVTGTRLDTAVRAVLEDAAGVRQVVDLGFVPADGQRHVVTGRIGGASSARADTPTALSPPLRLVAVQTSSVTQIESFDDIGFNNPELRTTLTLRNLRALPAGWDDPDAKDAESTDGAESTDDAKSTDRAGQVDEADLGTAVRVPEAFDWQLFSPAGFADKPDPVAAGRGRVLVKARISVPLAFGFDDNARTDITFTRWTPAESVPGVATDALLKRLRVEVGDQIAVRADGWAFLVDVVAAVPLVPTTDPARAALVLDQDRLSRLLLERGDTADLVDEWWAKAPSEASALAAAKAVRDNRIGTATSRAGLAREFAEQPLRVGFQGALWLVIVAAAAFAAIGFAMHTTVAVRLRRTEFSQLRALGITRRSLTAVVATENLLLCVIGVACGIGLGVLLGLLVGPMVSLAADGSRPVPSVLVVIPWGAVGLLALEIVAILALVVLVVTRVLRKSVLGSVLRLGDER